MSNHLIKNLFTGDLQVSEDVRERIEAFLESQETTINTDGSTDTSTNDDLFFSVTKDVTSGSASVLAARAEATKDLFDRLRDQLGESENSSASDVWQGGSILTPLNVTGKYMIGTPLRKWKAIWADFPLILTSDENKKHHIKNSDLGLDFIMNLRPVSYKLRINPRGDRHYGFLGQELKPALKGRSFAGVVENEAGFGLMYSELIAPLVKAVQEQQETITRLQSKMKDMEIKLRKLGG